MHFHANPTNSWISPSSMSSQVVSIEPGEKRRICGVHVQIHAVQKVPQSPQCLAAPELTKSPNLTLVERSELGAAS